MIAALAFAGLAQGALAQQVEKLSSVSHTVTGNIGAWTYEDGALYGTLRASNTYPQRPSWLVKLDVRTGKFSVLSDPERFDAGDPVMFTKTRILSRVADIWNRGTTYALLSRDPVEDMTDIVLRHDINDIMDRNGELWVLQPHQSSWGVDNGVALMAISRFEPDDMTYLGRIDIPGLSRRATGLFTSDGNGVLGMAGLPSCAERVRCYSLQKLTFDGTIVSAVTVREPEVYRCYEPDGVIKVSDKIVIFRVGCHTLVTDAGVTRVLYRLPDADKIREIEIGENLIFVRDRTVYQNADKTASFAPLMIYDIGSGDFLGAREDFQTRFQAEGDTLITWGATSLDPKNPLKGEWEMKAEVFRFNPDSFRRMGPR